MLGSRACCLQWFKIEMEVFGISLPHEKKL